MPTCRLISAGFHCTKANSRLYKMSHLGCCGTTKRMCLYSFARDIIHPFRFSTMESPAIMTVDFCCCPLHIYYFVHGLITTVVRPMFFLLLLLIWMTLTLSTLLLLLLLLCWLIGLMARQCYSSVCAVRVRFFFTLFCFGCSFA